MSHGDFPTPPAVPTEGRETTDERCPLCGNHRMTPWASNATTGIPNDNIDVGIYSADGTRIVSAGSTAQSGTEIAQNFAIADTLIGPGDFYLAMVMNGT